MKQDCMQLTKDNLVNAIAEKSNISKAQAREQIHNVMDGLVDLVSTMNVGDKLVLVNYLTIEKTHLNAREGRNPLTKEVIQISAKDKLKATFGKNFKEVL